MPKILEQLQFAFSAKGMAALVTALKSHRTSVIISASVTVVSLATFVYINISKSAHSTLVFLDNIENRSLDGRFTIRGPRRPDPNIIVIAIDQKTIDRLGWPFPRSHYARVLQTLKRDGARVVGFDVDFPLPDRYNGATLISQVEGEYRQAHGSGTKDPFVERLGSMREEADTDAQFARGLKETGNVVLGHLFFANASDVAHMDPQQIKSYNEVLAYQAFPQTLKRPSSTPYHFYMEAPVMGAVEPNLRIFADAARSAGSFNTEAENDGTYRRASLIFHYVDPAATVESDTFYPSLDIQIARLYLGAEAQETLLWFNQSGPELIELAGKKIYPDSSGRVLINFAGGTQTYPYYSFADVADGVTPQGLFKDKIAIVGATALGIGDIRPTPFAKQGYPGVEIHANVVDNILHESFLRRGFSEEITDLFVLLCCGLVMGLIFVLVRPLTSTISYAVAAIALVAFVYFNFSAYGRWLSVVLPFGTLTLNYLGVVSHRVLFEEKEKRKVRGAFSQYVAPGFISQILKDPGRLKLGGEEVELTVMFSDIRGFTSISEKLSPPALVELLNEYLTVMTDIVFQNKGTLDKYIGDAVMAFWGRPFLDQQDHAANACRAALRMISGLHELNTTWKSQGRPTLKIGVGLNTGKMMVGNMGSLRRFNYTVMGDHVNLSSRTEGLTKEYGVQILLTEYTYQHVKDQFVTRELDLIRVKGKQQPVAIYELLGEASEQARYQELLRDFTEGLTAYKAGEWETAYDIFRTLATKYPSDGPTQLLYKRSKTFLEQAPVGVWDGVYTMTTK
ncbi:MAG: adenylate/guanylate cyclase domain-containing protein [Acidobacteria bacterium]|nr:adenylate/guanylate cyclase domain-containing protein [Acidobacteriota bacterium]